jgi:adenylosuccinate synthase
MVDIISGLQWGDEGKGKVVDALAPQYHVVARFQGGPNAGHTLQFDGKKIVLHCMPSGIFNAGSLNVIGSGVVLDPIVLVDEIRQIDATTATSKGKVVISKRAHLILPTHRIIDAAQETKKGNAKIGSTLRGISPAYTDKIARSGLRAGDILRPDFKEKYLAAKKNHLQYLQMFDFPFELKDEEQQWLQCIEMLKKTISIDDTEYIINDYASRGCVLAEGAQGAMLDVDFGAYPYVTSSNTIAAGCCTGLGIPPHKVGRIIGIFKAYCTRVGSGPFPTEQDNECGEQMRQQGSEYGSTTGRSRRCGWLDLVALRYAIMLCGATELYMMKADVLDNFNVVKVAVKYRVNGVETDRYPYDTDAHIEPIYKEFRGWQTNISECRREEDLPTELQEYIRFIEEQTGVPVKFVSVGADRTESVVM